LGEERGFRDLKVYRLAYRLAMDVFALTRTFPREERYSLTDQLCRSSRSVAANLAEGYRKRAYPKLFVLKMVECDGETAETQVWLDMARDCGYLDPQEHERLSSQYQEGGKMLHSMIANPERFAP
jgi:four helix bundle protein